MPAFNSVAKFSVAKPAASITTEFVVSVGSFTLTGQAVLFQPQIVLEAGSFTLSGQNIVFQTQFVLGTGAFTLSGQEAVLDTQFDASRGQFTLTGQDITFTTSIAAGVGGFALSGQDAVFQTALVLDAGSFAISGQNINLYESSLEPGQFVLTGNPLPETFREIYTGQFFPAEDERGYDLQDTLGIFAKEHRRKVEELEVQQLMELEDRMIADALAPFVRLKDAA